MQRVRMIVLTHLLSFVHLGYQMRLRLTIREDFKKIEGVTVFYDYETLID